MGKRKYLPPGAEAIRVASAIAVSCVNERLAHRALVWTWQMGYRYGRAAAKRQLQGKKDAP